jgi:hypothetical protein
MLVGLAQPRSCSRARPTPTSTEERRCRPRRRRPSALPVPGRRSSTWWPIFSGRRRGRRRSLMHARAQEAWTLERLAERAGLSRSLSHFIGQPPMQYLASWRMQLASARLRGPTPRSSTSRSTSATRTRPHLPVRSVASWARYPPRGAETVAAEPRPLWTAPQSESHDRARRTRRRSSTEDGAFDHDCSFASATTAAHGPGRRRQRQASTSITAARIRSALRYAARGRLRSDHGNRHRSACDAGSVARPASCTVERPTERTDQ